MTRSHKQAAGGPPRQVRIIGGQWKRSLLPVSSLEGLRPTPDRVRETVFNWLHHLFEGRWQSLSVLDLFAGSGALGFESASRGASHVVMVEQAMPAVRVLQQVRDKLQAAQVEILRADARDAVKTLGRASFDLVFLDPPYSLALLPDLLPACVPLLKPHALVYAESDKPLPAEDSGWLAGWKVVRQDRAGAVHFCLLQCIKVA